jgi:hypothetical protein
LAIIVNNSLLELGTRKSRHLEEVIAGLSNQGYEDIVEKPELGVKAFLMGDCLARTITLQIA